MSSIGIDCHILLDNTGYFIKPDTYRIKQPRLRHTTYRADSTLGYTDLGPGKRTWSMTVLASNDLLRYDGTHTGILGQQYRDTLHNSYSSNIGTTINFTDPLNGTAIPIYFDNYEEHILDLHSQIIAIATGGAPGASYEILIELLEA